MYAAKLPEPWMIAEIERMRRDNERDDRPALELPLPPPTRRPEMDDSDRRGGTVIVIEL
jgi:hypothetical protein